MANIRLYRLDHCTYMCQYHIVWTTKWRGQVLSDKYIKQELKRMFKYIAKWKGCIIKAWHVGDDHVHLYIIIPPKYSVSYIIQILKGKSSSWIKKKTNKYPQGSLWGRGYYASTVGLDQYAVKTYVDNQHAHHRDIATLPFGTNKKA